VSVIHQMSDVKQEKYFRCLTNHREKRWLRVKKINLRAKIETIKDQKCFYANYLKDLRPEKENVISFLIILRQLRR
jgi:hypothetical protein